MKNPLLEENNLEKKEIELSGEQEEQDHIKNQSDSQLEESETNTPADNQNKEFSPSHIENEIDINKTRTAFWVAFAMGLIPNCFMGFGLFLSVEDNLRNYLTIKQPMSTWWAINLGILIVILLITKKIRQGATAGFGLAAIGVLLFSSIFMASNYHVPSQEEKCATLQELEGIVNEGMGISADDSYQAVKDLRGNLGDFLRVQHKTTAYIDGYSPVYEALRETIDKIDDLGDQGLLSYTVKVIHALVFKMETALKPVVNEYCNP